MKTLYAKLSLGLAVLLVAIGLLYAGISAMTTRNYVQEVNQSLNRNLARDLVADRNLVAQGRIDQSALKETFRQYMVINPGIEIYLLDLQGNILSYSADPEKVKRNKVAIAPIKAFLGMQQPYPLRGDDPRQHGIQKAFSVTPVPNSKTPEGYLYVVLRGQEFDRVEQVIQNSYFLRISSWAVAISLGFGLLAGLLIFRLLTRRLQHLSSSMEAFQNSDFSIAPPSPCATESADEIDQLSITFNRMSERIAQQIEQLREKDNQRRKLVAQVSHDLRTPLASIQGYLETLQIKGENLSDAERAEFLQIALRQGQKLSRLIAELFELASLDAQEKAPHTEPFNAAELVYDTVQKHRLQAEQQTISLAIEADTGLPFALGDLALTERVLDNLLDNALAHTPSGGKITLTLSCQAQQLDVSIQDSGPGIADADLPHLFDPFFRANANAADSHHAGLGLAIAKRMMELQQGVITASSETGQGACFSIRLPLANQPID